MKKYVYLSFALLLTGLAACKKDKKTTDNNNNGGTNNTITVDEKNTALYGKVTATWCGPCGAWGWTLNDEIITAVGEDAVCMGVYGSSSSNFTNAAANQFYTDFGANGYPSFTLNASNRTAYSTSGGVYTTTTKSNVINATAAFKATPVQANTGGKLSWDGDKLNIKAALKFFKDNTGEFYVAAYMIEDKAKSIQNSQTGVVEHHHVLRGSMSTDVYGVKYTGASTAGTTTNLADYTYTVGSDWVKSNVYVALVIWKKNGTKYEFVNACKVKA